MRTLVVWMAACLALGCGMAGAAPAAPSAAALDDQVTVAGEARDTPRVAASGGGVPLRAALRQIVPADYSVILPNAGAWAATPVTWSGGRPLAQTLREMLAGHPELAVQIDTDFQLVTVRYRPPFGADTVGALASANAAASQPAIAAAATPHGQTIAARPAVSAASGTAANAANSSNTTSPATNASLDPGETRVEVGGPIDGVQAGPRALDAVRAMPVNDTPHRDPDSLALTQGSTKTAASAAVPHAASGTRVPANGAASAQQSAAVSAPPPQVWRISLADHTVRGALTRWTEEAGWRLIWEAPVDFAVDAPATVTGSFDDALQSVVSALAGSDSPVQAILYRGNKVVRIVEKGAG